MIKLKSLLKEVVLPTDIPKTLYHGTFDALAKDIEKDGIIPGGTDVQNFTGIEKGVYFGTTPEFAGSMVEATENENIPEEWFDEVVIISVDTSKLDISKLDTDPNVSFGDDISVYSFIYRGKVSPEAIINIKDYN